MKTFADQWLATAIGSLPAYRRRGGLRVDPLPRCEQAPAWPQLPRRDFHENMYVQYSEGLPGMCGRPFTGRRSTARSRKVSGRKRRPSSRTAWRTGPGVSPSARTIAVGLHRFAEMVKEEEKVYPVPQGAGDRAHQLRADGHRREQPPHPLRRDLRDILVKLLGMKARWMRDFLADPPAGRSRWSSSSTSPTCPWWAPPWSASTPISWWMRSNRCAEQVEGLTGVHCCGNTDWSLLLRSRVDIVNFDACEYLENLALYPGELKAFLERGGRLAWGLVPNNERALSEDLAGLRAQLKLGMALLEERGVPEERLRKGHAGHPQLRPGRSGGGRGRGRLPADRRVRQGVERGMVGMREGQRLPRWFLQPVRSGGNMREVEELLKRYELHTVCESARCPNRMECFSRGTATFMIMGDRCTRDCGFCGVEKGEPLPLEPEEPARVAEVARRLGLDHVVVTSVTRDDLPGRRSGPLRGDHPGGRASAAGGRHRGAGARFRGKRREPVHGGGGGAQRLQPQPGDGPAAVPEGAPGSRLPALPAPAAGGQGTPPRPGHQERADGGAGERSGRNWRRPFCDLAQAGCDILTLGQYLRPRAGCLEVERFWEPREFEELEDIARGCGLREVVSAPLVRSSYRARESMQRITC